MNRPHAGQPLLGALLLLLGAVVVLGLSCSALRGALVGPGARAPGTISAGEIGPAARALVDASFADLGGARPLDLHVHVAGLGTGGSGCTVNPKMRSFLHPWLRTQFAFYMEAAGVEDLEQGDAQYVERLLELSRAVEPRPRLALVALDRYYRDDGTVDEACTPIHVPNDYVLRLSREHPDVFLPVVSVHPYRPDAPAELERSHAAGARIVKWLPNSMGIDPASPRCDAFYEKMASLSMTLLTHAGEEKALAAEGTEDLGNPLRLRRPLERGVRVIVAHCGSLGTGEDLDAPVSGERADVECFDLFLRLMDEPRWKGLLYGELSAVCLRNRDPRVLRTLLERTDLHERLVDGSDWPLPAIRVTTSTRKFQRAGLLTEGEREALDEIRDANPLLFDFVLKRTVRGPKGERFPASVFLPRSSILP